MSLTGALNAALTSLKVTQAALQVTSANVAHANDPNYTAKRLDQKSVDLGGQQIGGVDIAAYRSAVDIALKRQWESFISQSSLSEVQSNYLGRIGDLLGTNGDQTRLVTSVNGLIAAFQTLEANPDSAAARQSLLSAGQNLANEVRQIAGGLDRIRQELREETKQATDQLNGIVSEIFEVNNQLRSAISNGPEQADLTDKRDQLLRELAKITDIVTIDQGNGSVSIFTASGLSLLDGAPVRFDFDGINLIRIDDQTEVSNSFRGGKLRGLLDLASTQVNADPAKSAIWKVQDQLDGLVDLFTDPNNAFSQAYDNADFSQRLTGSIVTTITPSATQPQYSSISLGGTAQAGDVFEISLNGKIFTYQVSNSNQSLDNVALQLANKINADTTLGVSAIAGVAGLQLVGATNNQSFRSALRINNQIPELGSGFFQGNDRYNFQINEQLAQGTASVKRNAAEEVASTLLSASHGFGAGGLNLNGVSYRDVATSIAGTLSANIKTLKDRFQFDEQARSLTEQRYQSATGVNIDAEIANLQVIQNTYAASARILSVVQDLFQQLQAAVSR